jgi:sodium-dependent phosphate transporter
VQCQTGVWDCANSKFSSVLADALAEPNPPAADTQCACFNGGYTNPKKMTWLLALASIFGLLMAFGIGANDAANSWGTTVGSGALGLRLAMLIGGVMELAGAMSIGYGVAKTIKGVASITEPTCFACGYCDSEMGQYSVAMFSALIGASVFLMICSVTWMPVSTTHSIVGAALGATWVSTSWSCLNWKIDGGLGGIVLSWVVSPLVSGFLGAMGYLITKYLILKPKLGGNARTNALWGVPILYGLQTWIIIFMILLKFPTTKKTWPYSQMVWVSAICGVVVTLASIPLAIKVIKPRLPSVVAEEAENIKNHGALKADPDAPKESGIGAWFRREFALTKTGGAAYGDANAARAGTDPEKAKAATSDKGPLGTRAEVLTASVEMGPEEVYTEEELDGVFCFRYLLVFVAALESFAHGSNDTGNATGAFSAVLQSYQEGLNACSKPETPVWVMAVAGIFVAIGMNTLGYRVVQTIGTSLTDINYHRGWAVEFGSTFTVVIATILSMPVSTTHCQVGAVVAVGCVAFGPKHVRFGLFGKIFLTWVLTLPFAGGIAAAMAALIRLGVKQ